MSKHFNTEFCKGCSTNQNFPTCTVYSLPLINSLQDILTNNTTAETYMDVFVCPADAQIIDNNNLVINRKKCKECKLCYLRCSSSDNKLEKNFPIINIENVLFKSLYTMCAALSIYFSDNFKFYPEVNSPGNARDKRIDIVAKSNKNLYFIKVLKTLHKSGFYVRSYKSIFDSISDLNLLELDIHLVMLVPSTIQNDISSIDENTFIVPFNKFEHFITNG